MGWAILAIGIVAGTGLLWLILRPGDAVRAGTELTKDGFFVRGSHALGARIRYRVRVNGTWRTGTAELAGAETFVYTGATPTEVEILALEQEEISPVSSIPSLASRDDDDDDSGGSDSGFAGAPSAY